ncbi:hypothetical protein O0L34_g10080 [Tuta absoluta]|nr:hypothetical protein O0L34_g10080 [Tuta absoluta]
MSKKMLKDTDIEKELLNKHSESEFSNNYEECFSPITLEDLGVSRDCDQVSCDKFTLSGNVLKTLGVYCDQNELKTKQDNSQAVSADNIYKSTLTDNDVDPFSSDDDQLDPDWIPMAKKRSRGSRSTDTDDKPNINLKKRKRINIIRSDDEDDTILSQPTITSKEIQNLKIQIPLDNIFKGNIVPKQQDSLNVHSFFDTKDTYQKEQDSQEIHLYYQESVEEAQEQDTEKLPKARERLIKEAQGQDIENLPKAGERSVEEVQVQDTKNLPKAGERSVEEVQEQDTENLPKAGERSVEEVQEQDTENLPKAGERSVEEVQEQDTENLPKAGERLVEEVQEQDTENLPKAGERSVEEVQEQDTENLPKAGERSVEEVQEQDTENLPKAGERSVEEVQEQDTENLPKAGERSVEEVQEQDTENLPKAGERSVEEVQEQDTENLPKAGERSVEEVQGHENILELPENTVNIGERPNEVQDLESFSKQRKVNKTARALGKPYLGFKKVEEKLLLCVEKPARILKERCTHSNTSFKTKNTPLCALITDEDRESIHKTFWDFKSWEEKKGFIKASAIRREIKRRHKTSRQSIIKKKTGHDFNLCQIRVCKKFYLNTLCIGEDSLRRWTREADRVFDDNATDMPNQIITRQETTNTALQIQIKSWIDLLPKVPSHYCRASSKKLYVDSTFRSVLHMYDVYKQWCQDNNKRPAARMTFLKVLNQENIGIHHPRKDQCDTCCSFKTGNITKESYDQHIAKKNEARKAKKEAISKASVSELNDVVVITVDVQSVLLAPKLLASAIYYKQKLQCHNFTVYNTKSKDVTVYFWHEADGNVSANEFTSCVVDYIERLPDNTKEVIIISDGCGHQNRNRVLSSALSDLSIKKKITVEQLYLEKGHTMMEVDSVHSTIEQYIKPPIYAPSDYIMRIGQARPHQPYEIKSLHYDFFLNYEELESNLKSIRPGRKKGDPVVVDIRGLKYFEDGSILFKLRHPDEWTTLPQRRQIPRGGSETPKKLYSERIKIAESKFKHLQELKAVIDNDYHPFYDSLNYLSGV